MGSGLNGILGIHLPGVGTTGISLDALNQKLARYGLALSDVDMFMLEEGRRKALADTGRVEIGPGAAGDIAVVFAESPYVSQDGFAELVDALQALFYRLREEDGEVSDIELVDAMRLAFDDVAKGSIDLLEGMSISDLEGWLAEGADEPEEEVEVEEPLPRPWNEDVWLDSVECDGWCGERWGDEYER
jgi:hypothetical protein